jgi:hypothetical protein
MRSIPFVAVALLCAASAALAADEPPKRKDGLWQLTMSGQKLGDRTFETCVDRKSDDLMGQKAQAAAKAACSKNEVSRQGNRVTIDAVCTMGKTTSTTHAVFTGDFDSAYRMESTSTYSPPVAGMSEGKVTIDAKWLGPCKPGQKPGDIAMKRGG